MNQASPSAADNAPKASVLVVDDNEMNRDMLARRLQRSGYDTILAVDGPEALDLLNTEPVDIVLLDIRMPIMSGIEVLEKIRETRGKLDLPVIMVTAEDDSAVTVSAIQLGANDYVTKPIDFPVALARIESHLGAASEAATRGGADTLVASTDRLPSGFVLDDRYLIDGPVGHGGFAVVYKATQRSTGQTVAIKLMRADRILEAANAPTELARFDREMQIIATIQHPNIVRLIDSGRLTVVAGGVSRDTPTASFDATRVGTEAAEVQRHTPAQPDDTVAVPYIVMEYLDGHTLESEVRRRGTLTESETVDMILPVISAVRAAHAAGIVHRDLTPSNISLVDGPDGQTVSKVLDFGIAKITGNGVADLTTTASAIGTPNYMSPEQARGEQMTAASDQYTIATVIYECLTGRCPHQSDSFIALLHMVASGEFPPPRSLNPEISEELEAVVLRAMASRPNDRYDSVESLGQALVSIASDSTSALWAPVFSATT